jgi:GNAT superfamily N-acetyltransferase
LPTAAVTAVVPYRPPVTLPGPADLLARALTFATSLPVRRAVGVGDVPGGVAVLDPDVVHSKDNNRVLFTSPVDADAVVAATEEVGGNAGWPHRAAGLLWPGADDVAADLRGRGWNTLGLVQMGRPAAPTAGGERVDLVDEDEVHEFWRQSWRRDLPDLPDRERVIADLVGRERLNDRFVAVTNLVVREAGRVVASGQLRIDGATAAVDSVLTDPAAQGRGHAGAVLARAIDLAWGSGCDLVVLEAAADDWPRHWYARRGFTELGIVWTVDRRP